MLYDGRNEDRSGYVRVGGQTGHPGQIDVRLHTTTTACPSISIPVARPDR